MNINNEFDETNIDKLKKELIYLLERMSKEQRQHFYHAIQQVAGCYLNPEQHGALLISTTQEESQSLVAINASNVQVAEMLGFMSQMIGQAADFAGSPYLN